MAGRAASPWASRACQEMHTVPPVGFLLPLLGTSTHNSPKWAPGLCVHCSHVHIPGNKTALGTNFKQGNTTPSLGRRIQVLQGR